MKFTLHDVDINDADYILALRAAVSVAKTSPKVGAVKFIEYENGKVYAVTVNKESVDVWPESAA